jgi:putative component of membrane protein insertase Oxa1/YidC/SpoIIIJ protein YidD
VINDKSELSSTNSEWITPDGYVKSIRPPGSWNDVVVVVEKRDLVKPNIKWKNAVVHLCLLMLGCALLFLFLDWWAFLFLVVYAIFGGKHAIIFIICVYQRYAPEHIRLRCVFNPSCSEYMILCLKKYGILGVFKGIKRIFRCRYPNGGNDYP